MIPDAVGRYAIVGVAHEGGVGLVPEAAAAALDPERRAHRLVVRAGEEPEPPAETRLRGRVAVQVYHTANGVGAVGKGGRALYHLYPVDGILVGLEPVVVAPLLALVLHAVLGHHHAVEAKAPDHGLRTARAYRHGPHAGQARQALHERAAEVVFNVTAVGTDGVESRAHLHAGGTCAAAYHHFTQGYAAIHRRLADTVGNHGHGTATHRRRGRHSGRAQRTAWQDEEGKRSHCYLPFHLDEIKMCYGLGAAVNAGRGNGPPPRQSAPAPPKAATAMGAARNGNHGARGRPGRKAD